MRYAGTIGFGKTVEKEPGIWSLCITERPYYGDVKTNSRRWVEQSTSTNDDLTLGNSFSIIADDFAYCNLSAMRYITYLGEKWKITGVQIQRPRIDITIGGIWHEQCGRKETM